MWWHIGTLAGAAAGATLEWNIYCTGETAGQAPDHNCLTIMAEPEHAAFGAIGAGIGLVVGLAIDKHEHP